MQDDEPRGTIPVPDFLKLPIVEPRKYSLAEAAKLIAGRYGNVDEVLDFITEQLGEQSRDIDAERVRGFAAAYRSPARKATVTGCEALHWMAFGFLVGDDEARAREEHLGHRWCHAPLATARPVLQAAAEDPPRYAAAHDMDVVQEMLRRVSLEGEHPDGPRELLDLYDRDTAEEEWRRRLLHAASRRLLHELQKERFVVWGDPSDGSSRREIPLKCLTTPGMIFSVTSRFQPDGQAPMDVWAVRRNEMKWRDIVFPADAIHALRESPSFGSAPSRQFKKRPLPKPKLRKHLEGIKATGGPIPAADRLFPEVVKAFPDHHVTREDVRSVHGEVWGKQPPGRRRNSAT